ncbi:hypothetical protein KDJ56_09665 [Brevibacillus composti]|uniref:RNA polymerase subunit sigma n=1 Tax=Brevibacillus composti TaxID=2796470 RepID=A0A7T5JQE1_9BACL|nr:hypothetical protein [Brevibacillus composti]QQE76157.1 hypothetical protein JD108_09970 [Brevibacillus composti]QUO43186.1 hypothetical protein KDJ56_09665 [Brevibacillus composti]
MSLKTVELQVAVPRTAEVGRLQEQYQNRLHNEQHLLHQEQKITDRQKSQRAADVNETEKNRLREKEREQQHGGRDFSSRASEEGGSPSEGNSPSTVEVAMRDPLRGRYIDISL